jgi:hypothetical protein
MGTYFKLSSLVLLPDLMAIVEPVRAKHPGKTPQRNAVCVPILSPQAHDQDVDAVQSRCRDAWRVARCAGRPPILLCLVYRLWLREAGVRTDCVHGGGDSSYHCVSVQRLLGVGPCSAAGEQERVPCGTSSLAGGKGRGLERRLGITTGEDHQGPYMPPSSIHYMG